MPRPSLTLRPVVGAILLLLALLVAATPTLLAASITRAAPTGKSGEWEFQGRDFQPGEDVSLRLTGPAGQVLRYGDLRANDRGRVRARVLVPRHLQSGRWVVRMSGSESDKDDETAIGLPPPAPNVTLTVDPPGGGSGTSFRFASTEFAPGEVVSYWLTDPSGAALGGGETVAGGDGGAAFWWSAIASTPAGTWQMAAYGQSSDRLAVVAFVVGE